MGLTHAGYVELPAHEKAGGFDHVAFHDGSKLMFAAHTANDAIDVIDCITNRFARSVPGLRGVAGALVSEELDLVFTSNRGENTVGIFRPDSESLLARIPVGLKPNGLSLDTDRGLLLAANVGDPAVAGSHTVSMVDIERGTMIADVSVAGRTRWTIFDPESDKFYVNISAPSMIAVIDAADPTRIAASLPVPAAGPHGLDIDPFNRRLFCACDDRSLIVYEMLSGSMRRVLDLSGTPDVVFHNAALRHLYVAIGDPGVIDVIDTDLMERIEIVKTGLHAHTLGFDAGTNTVYAFLPDGHRAMVWRDGL